MLSKFDYLKPNSIEEALGYLDKNDDTKILAGGTDLLVVLRKNAVECKHILDIKGIPDTKEIKYIAGQGLFIGASVSVNQIAQSETIRDKYTALAEGADSLASYQLRNRATLAGNICNASPGSDLSPALLIFNAKVKIRSSRGERYVDIDKFFTGVKRTVLEKNEIVLGVLLPEMDEADKSIYLKQSRLKGHDLATVGVAIRLTSDKNVFVSICAVAPTALRLYKLEEMINARGLSSELPEWASKEIGNHISPISDVRSSAEYRLHISGVLLKRGLMKLMEMEVN